MLTGPHPAYFDESGTHGDPNGATTIGGFVATQHAWASVEAAWDAELKGWAQYGVQTYHAVDCLWGNKEFERLDQFKRHVIIFRLANILGEHDVQAIYSQVLNDEWEAATRGEASFLARYPKPYDFLFDDLVHQLRGWSKRKTRGEGVAPVFADHPEYTERSKEIFDAYLQQPSWSDCLTSITFSTPERLIPLQCADHIAFWIRFERERIENTEITLENGGYVNALGNAVRKNGLHQGGCWTHASLTKVAIPEFNRLGTLALS